MFTYMSEKHAIEAYQVLLKPLNSSYWNVIHDNIHNGAFEEDPSTLKLHPSIRFQC